MSEEVKEPEVIEPIQFDPKTFVSGNVSATDQFPDNKDDKPVETKDVIPQVEPSNDNFPGHDKTVTPATPITPTSTPTVSEMDDYWSQLKEDLGDTYTPPDIIVKGVKEDGTKLTKKEKWEILRSELYKYTDFGDDDFVEEYRSAKATEGFDRDKWIEGKTKANSLNDDDFLFAVYKSNLGKSESNKDGLTDEQLIDEIKKMSLIEKKKEVTSHRNAIENYLKEENNVKAKLNDEQFSTKVTEAQKVNKQLADDYLIKIKGKNNIEGIEFSDAELVDYHKEIPNLLKVEMKQGKDGQKYAMTKAQEILEGLLANEQSSLTLLPLLYKISKGQWNGYTSSIKERTKQEIIDKLDPKPPDTPGGSTNSSDTFDARRFLRGQ